MPFKTDLDASRALLNINLTGNLTARDFADLDAQAMGLLDKLLSKKVAVMIDARDAESVPRNFRQLHESQTWARRYELKWLLVVTDSKLIRLMMLLTYNHSRPSLRFFRNLDEANHFLRNLRHGEEKTGFINDDLT